ncbi:MAG: hypothetical protein A4E32_01697 [Methanomassiliicoccales archaeon PtaU1.Bin124]|nr:MAG: hypothetical protein A4E32_01697 [Methanomassiliicoccales archaeon PtaU1.Bin124]
MLPDHDHCKTCDDPVEKGEEFCSELCRDRYNDEVRREKNKNYLFIAVVVILLVALLAARYLVR